MITLRQTDTEWYIFMPDCIRTILSKASEADIDCHPGMREYSDTLADLTECNKRIQKFMDMGLVATLSLPGINSELNSLEQRYKAGRKKHLALCKKYSWAKDKEKTIQDSISDALEFINELKRVLALSSPEQFAMLESNKQQLLLTLMQVSHSEKIIGFDDVISLVSKIATIPDPVS